MAANQEIFDRLVRRDIRLRRLTRDELMQLLAYLERQTDSVDRLILAARNVERRANLEALLDDIRAARADVWREIGTRLDDWGQGVAIAEAENASAIMVALFGVTSAALAASVTTDITRRRAINGRTLGEWLEASQADELGRVAAALRIAAAAGANRAQLVREARRALGVTDRNLAAIVESLATHAASSAREEALTGAGANVAPRLTHWRWVSILDGRTSDVCRARSGKLYAVQSPHPTPPAHPRCRSSLAPVFEGQGRVREETYAQWLTRQPEDVQDEILGPERGRLFRSGRFTLTDFIEEPSGRRRRLDEL